MKKNIIIQDIDGTLANAQHRLHHIKKPKDSGKRNWKAFFDEAKDDPPYEHTVEMYKLLRYFGFDIWFITGRPENYREQTLEWLNKHLLVTGASIDPAKLLMRPAKDHSPDYEMKERVFMEHFGHRKDEVLCIFEDRLRVCEMWRRLGLNVFVCGDEWLEKDWSE